MKRKKLLSILLALALVLSLMPTAALADMAENGPETVTFTFTKDADYNSYVVYNGTNYQLNGDTINWNSGTVTIGDITFTARFPGSNTDRVSEMSPSYPEHDAYMYLQKFNYDVTMTFHCEKNYITHVKVYRYNNNISDYDNQAKDCTLTCAKGIYRIDVSLSRKATVSTYNIYYVLNGGTNSASNPATYTDDRATALYDASRTGHIFEGWYDNPGFSGTAITSIPVYSEGDKTFYAKWKCDIDGLTYDDANGWYVIDSAAALNALAAYTEDHGVGGKLFKQTVDIALSGNFTGLGSYNHPFSGTYDGGNHFVTGLSVKRYVNYLGFFRMTNGGTIQNVRLIRPNIDSSDTAGTRFCDGIGGLIGSSSGSTAVSNCFVIDPTLKGNGSSTGIFVGSAYSANCSDCYYYSDMTKTAGYGTAAASKLRTLTLPVGVTGGSVSASGDGVKFSYGGVTYCGENEQVTLTVTPEKSYILTGLTVNGTDVTDSVSNNTYTFNMPESDISVTASFVLETFTYVDLDGVTHTVVAERITSDSAVGLYSGWYAVDRDVTRDSGFNLVAGGDGVFINIILYDGVTLNLPNSTINTAGGGYPNLVIWGQENGNGALNCKSIIDQVASVTVNGGKLQCGVSNYNCTINGNLTVNRGEVHLTSGFNTCVNGNVTFNGGILDCGKISGNTTLNWTANTDRVKASEYVGSVTVADDKYFKDTNGNFYTGTLTAEQKNAIKNVELMPSPNAHTVSINDFENGTASVDKPIAEPDDTVTLTVVPDTGYRVTSVVVIDEGGSIIFHAVPIFNAEPDNTHSFTMPDKNVTITITIETADYWIDYYDVDDAVFASENPTSYTVLSEDITLVNPTRTGYDFIGWTGTDLDELTTTVTIASGSTGDRSYTANWEPHTYTVSFDANGGDGSMDDMDFTYDVSQTLTASAFTRTGYTFAGWNTASNGSGTPYTEGQSVQNLTAEDGATVTLYAQWTTNTYTVHFESNCDRASGTMADQTFAYDQEPTALSALAFSVTTGEFLYWTTEADGSGDVYADGAEIKNLTDVQGAVITLYAQWHLMHDINYDIDVFRCYPVNDVNRPYHAYAGETVVVTVKNAVYEYTVTVCTQDGETVAFNEDTMTFVMPDEDVWITYTSVKNIAYTTILLDDFESYENIVYLYDAAHPTVTPTVTVMDGETTLTEGVDYTLDITDNTGSPDRAVEATVKITGMGDYIGTNTKTFHITPFNIANCEIKGKLEAYDDGYGIYYPLTENVEVWYGETQLECNVDYEIDVEEPTSGEFEVGQTYQATVRGIGNWGGSQSFTFTVIELTHTVVFDANGGTGSMANDVATRGERYTLPDCGFTAPAGMEFSHWVVSCEPDAEKQPGDYFTAPYIWSPAEAQTITVTAYWKIPDGFYLIGPDWTVNAIDAGDRFEENPNAAGEYMLNTKLRVGDQIKVVKVENGAIAAWYPNGLDNQYTVDAPHAGDVTVYFRETCNNAWSDFGGYFYIEAVTAPSFKTHSLVLSGKIGVNFFMDLPAIDGVDYAESYMTFEISGKGTVPSEPVPYDSTHTNAKSTYYGFSCYVNSIQMADTITATFHYGDGQTISEEYSIKQYISSFDTYIAEHPDAYDDETIALVHALADYGHYVQPFLSAARGWTIGSGDDQYAEMDLSYAESYDITAIKAAVADHAIDRALYGDIEKVTYTLLMDSDTAIYLYFKPIADYDGSFSVDGYTATKQKDGRYLVKIPNIGAHKLGDPYTVVVTTTNGESTVKVSALSYVYGILNSDAYADNQTAQYAAASIYHYYAAAAAYKTLHP